MVSSITNIPCSNKKASDAFDGIRHTLEAVHQMSKVKGKTAGIREALATTEHDFCFSTAQMFLKNYRSLINNYAFLTGVVVINITTEESQATDILYWKSVLRLVEMLLYADEAMHCGLQAVIEEKLRKLFFSEHQ